ncbi:unnamed protein product [Rotaria socialis]|uniref:PCIF1 WW domain-containing protein n=1 Tax=Rotaria socialis TaxID=392032 RepID=A0A821EVM7_9BILA|nr:unnamed protein product [Rotaria socialis]CAF4640482.1 unnamed protein product [Rotaria socialis]
MSNTSRSAVQTLEPVPPTSACYENTPNRGLVETELVREKLYEQVLNSIKSWLSSQQAYPPWSKKNIWHILLRYIFIKKAALSRPMPDPVFAIGTCSVARQQLRRDLEKRKVNNFTELAKLIDHQLEIAALEICVANIGMDAPVTVSNIDGDLIYRGRVQKDFSRLAQRFGPDYYHAAYALGLRYKYIHLCGHGLAREYEKETKLSANYPFIRECFASTFNHYFDQYHSAFPDLEGFFGSRGCFFKAAWEKDPAGMIYYVCPPFDDTLMQLCVERVLYVLKHQLVSCARFIFTIPGSWTNFKALQQLKTSPWTVQITDYPIGKLRFIDYMAENTPRILYPTDICEVTLTNCNC